MNHQELLLEAEQQSQALRRIAKWRSAAMFIASLGVLLAYINLANGPVNILGAALGVVLILTGTLLAIVLNVGIHNGRSNVEKLLDAAEKSGE